MARQTITTNRKKVDARILPLAKLLCEQWDDSWYLGHKIHKANAKDILDLIDGLKS